MQLTWLRWIIVVLPFALAGIICSVLHAAFGWFAAMPAWISWAELVLEAALVVWVILLFIERACKQFL